MQIRDLVSILTYYSTNSMEFGNNMVLAAYSPLCSNSTGEKPGQTKKCCVNLASKVIKKRGKAKD